MVGKGFAPLCTKSFLVWHSFTWMHEDRAAEFRDQVGRRLTGELTEEQFKPLRLMNGLYLQLHAYMLRVAIPYGTLSSTQLRQLAHIGRRYDKGYARFTTRTNLQFNWIKLDQAPDILDALEVDLHAIQTSRNCVRNITADPYAGATAGHAVRFHGHDQGHRRHP